MNKNKLLSLLFLFTCAVAQAQYLDWAKSIGSLDSETPHVIITDKDGNVYTVGEFWGQADFDPGAGEFRMVPGAMSATYILKLDAQGKFVWAKVLSGRTWGNGIQLDNMGNVYILGYFEGSADFDPGVGEYLVTTDPIQSAKMYLCKLSADGAFRWVKTFGDIAGDAVGESLYIDSMSNLYTTGRFWGTVDFDPSGNTFNLTSTGKGTMFVAKFDTSGQLAWSKPIHGNGLYNQTSSITADKEGNCYTIGIFDETADFDPGTVQFFEVSNGGTDIFILKLDATGNFEWVKKYGGPNPDVGNSLTIDNEGNLYAAGHFVSTANFSPTINLTSKGSYDIFISKLDVTGQLLWVKSIGGAGEDLCLSIHHDGQGHLYATGSFQQTVDFDPGSATYVLKAINAVSNPFVSAFDESGNFSWARSISCPRPFTSGYCITTDVNGNIYTTGTFGDTSYFPQVTTSPVLVSKGNLDIFITRHSPGLTGVDNNKGSSPQIIFFPNPTNGVFTIEGVDIHSRNDVMITDITGKIVYFSPNVTETTIDISNLEPGPYFMSLQNIHGLIHQKLVLSR